MKQKYEIQGTGTELVQDEHVVRMKQKYEIQAVTPVHIGSGETLNHIDGCYAEGRWHHISLDKVLEHPSVDINSLTSEMARHDFRWDRYLRQRGVDIAEVSAYSLTCRQSPENVELREAIMTVENRPYIPGSTLKGAIRTALLEEILNQSDSIYDKSLDRLDALIDQRPRGNPRNERPGRSVERLGLGNDPNRDLLRALQVSDTTSLDSDSLEIGMAWTVTLNRNDQLVQKTEGNTEYKNFVQQIQVGQRLTFTLKVDDFLLREHEKEQLDFTDLQEETLRNVAAACQYRNQRCLSIEREFFDRYNFTEIAELYDKLIGFNDTLINSDESRHDNVFLLQVGWGGGYHANTVTSLFTDDEQSPKDLMMDLRKRFKLGESRSRRGEYDPREFPKTRRVLYSGQTPIAPFGWVKVSPIPD